MATNMVQDGENITLPAPYAVTAGQGCLAGSVFGIAHAAAAITANVVLVRRGVFTVAKVSAQAWVLGEKIYWDNAAKLFTNVLTANTLGGLETVFEKIEAARAAGKWLAGYFSYEAGALFDC